MERYVALFNGLFVFHFVFSFFIYLLSKNSGVSSHTLLQLSSRGSVPLGMCYIRLVPETLGICVSLLECLENNFGLWEHLWLFLELGLTLEAFLLVLSQ